MSDKQNNNYYPAEDKILVFQDTIGFRPYEQFFTKESVKHPAKANAQIDHIIPITRNGTHKLENLRWVCTQANLAKRNLIDEEFYAFCQDVVEFLGWRLRECLIN